MKKRFLSVFLALALCVGLAIPACAADTKATYYLNLSQITTAENSEVSITGEGLKQTGEIFDEYGLIAGRGPAEAPHYYPVFTASKPVTVTVTADYTDWRYTGTNREAGDNFDFIGGATVTGLSYNPATGEYTETTEHAAYFDGTYAIHMPDGSIKENAGTLKEYYTRSTDEYMWIHIYAGATVTLSEPGIYKISVTSWDLWSTRMNYAVIHITADNSQPANPPSPSFTDVPGWCSNAVDWAVSKGITQGTGNNEFSTMRTCTHAEILTFLWRAAGQQPAKAKAPVTVVSYFQDAVDWAYGEGLIGASFDAMADCTRADAVRYIWQAFGKHSAPAGSFSDVPAGADYAPAVNWAVANGITKGTGDGTVFSPAKTCTRGEIVTFLHRAYVPEARLA